MKTSAIEVHDMLSVFSVDEVEKRIGEVPGVLSVTVNFAVGNATVRYDETQLEASDIKSAVRQRGFDAAAPADGPAGDGVGGKAPAGAPPAAPASPQAGAAPAPADSPAATAAGAAAPDKAAAPAPPEPPLAEPPVAPDGAAGDEPTDKATPEKS